METQSPPIPSPRPVLCDAGVRSPAHASMAELLQMFAARLTDLNTGAQIPVLLRRVGAGQSLVHEGADAYAIFFVRSGTFKVFRTDEDGYEQVLAFAVRGEVLAFDVLCMKSYPAAMQALEDSSVFVIPRRDIAKISQDLPSFALVLQKAGSQTLAQSRDWVDILAAVDSDVRLARFLIQLSRQMAGCGQSPRLFLLRMGRREIASLLGVAHETVSRCFSALAAMRLIEVKNREIEILDMAGLREFSRNTRRQTDGAGRQYAGLFRQASRKHTSRRALLA